MQRRCFLLLLSLPLAPAALLAQPAAPPMRAADSATPGAADRAAQGFDFLLGEWVLDVYVKVSGLAALIHGQPVLSGTLKAWRTAEGIDDELLIVDASANPRSSSRSRRRFDAASGRWSIATTDTYHGRESTASGRWENGEMRVDGSHDNGSSSRTLTRTRYHAISADAFRMTQDRSQDGGASWEEGVLSYTARRSAAAAP